MRNQAMINVRETIDREIRNNMLEGEVRDSMLALAFMTFLTYENGIKDYKESEGSEDYIKMSVSTIIKFAVTDGVINESIMDEMITDLYQHVHDGNFISYDTNIVIEEPEDETAEFVKNANEFYNSIIIRIKERKDYKEFIYKFGINDGMEIINTSISETAYNESNINKSLKDFEMLIVEKVVDRIHEKLLTVENPKDDFKTDNVIETVEEPVMVEPAKKETLKKEKVIKDKKQHDNSNKSTNKVDEFVNATDNLKEVVESIGDLPKSKEKEEIQEFVQEKLNEIPNIIENQDKEKIVAAVNVASDKLQKLNKRTSMLFEYNDVLVGLTEDEAKNTLKLYPDLKRFLKLLKNNNMRCSLVDMISNGLYGNNILTKGLIVDILKDDVFVNRVILDIDRSIYKGDTAVLSACTKYLNTEVVVFLHESEAVMQLINKDAQPLKTKISTDHVHKLSSKDLTNIQKKKFKNVNDFLKELDKIPA